MGVVAYLCAILQKNHRVIRLSLEQSYLTAGNAETAEKINKISAFSARSAVNFYSDANRNAPHVPFWVMIVSLILIETNLRNICSRTK